MKVKDVLKILKVTRPTLCSYVKSGKIKATLLPNRTYEYDDDSVYKLAGIENRGSVIYCRVSTPNQKNDLFNQIETVKEYANKNGYNVTKVYSDIASGLSFDRGDFKEMIKDVIKYKIKTIFISHKDRFTRISFNMWKELCSEFGCEIIVINDVEEDDKGVFNDIISLLHCFSMKMYSKRRKKKIELVKDDLINDISE